MKKLISSLFAVVLSVVVLSSCGGAPSVDGIIEKYDAGTELTEADYSALIDYAQAAFDETLPLIEKAKSAMEDGDFEAIASLEEDSKAIEEKFVHIDKVGKILKNADEAQLGEANAKKFKEFEETAREMAF